MAKRNQTQLENELLAEKIEHQVKELKDVHIEKKKNIFGKEIPNLKPDEIESIIVQRDHYKLLSETLKKDKEILASKLDHMNSKSYVKQNQKLLDENQMLHEEIHRDHERISNLQERIEKLEEQLKNKDRLLDGFKTSPRFQREPEKKIEEDKEKLSPHKEEGSLNESVGLRQNPYLRQRESQVLRERESMSHSSEMVEPEKPKEVKKPKTKKKLLFLHVRKKNYSFNDSAVEGFILMNHNHEILYELDMEYEYINQERFVEREKINDIKKKVFEDREKIVSIINQYDRLVAFDTEQVLKELFSRMIAFNSCELFDLRLAIGHMNPKIFSEGELERLPAQRSHVQIKDLEALNLDIENAKKLTPLRLELEMIYRGFYLLGTRFPSFYSYWQLGVLIPFQELLKRWYD